MKVHRAAARIGLGTWVLGSLLPSALGDESVWIVPSEFPPLSIQAEGSVEISRKSVQTIRPGSPGAVVAWMGPDGKHAAFGDELIRLDTRELQEEHQDELNELVVLHQQSTNQMHTLDKSLATVTEDLAVRLENLKVKTAEAAQAGAPDPSRIATLKREIQLIQREAVLQEAELRRKKNLYALGEMSRIEIEDAELAVEATRRGIRIAELALTEAKDGSDEVLARRAAWQLERMRATIGVDENDQPLDDRGYGKKVAYLRSYIERKRGSQQQNITAQEVKVQGLAQAAWAHFPLRSLTLSNSTGVVRHIAAGDPDLTALYTPERGYGWLRKPRTAPSQEALVIRGRAQWRCDLEPGRYQATFVLGDVVEWNCMSVKQAGRPLVAVNRLVPGQLETYKVDLELGDDGLLLDIGLEHKAVLASAAGAVKYQSFIRLGESIRNNPPALYLTPSAELLVRFRVHYLQVPFFTDTPTAARRLELRNSAGEWIPGGNVVINEDPVPFFPPKEERHSVDTDDRPEERTAREIIVAVPPEHGDGFAFAAHVTCRIITEPKQGAMVVPSFLVFEGEDGVFVQRDGELAQVQGHRYDQHFILTRGIAAGDRLSLPRGAKSRNGEHRFTGEVVAGSAVPMVVPTRSWARIESLLPHGSKVEEDDLVLTLYRPKENEKAVYSAAKAVAAETTFLEAADEQQAAFLRETSAHAQAVEEEKLAADRVLENRRFDLAVLADAAEAERAAAEELKLLESRVEALAGKESTRLDYEDYRRRRDVMRLQTQSRKLSAVATLRAGDYTLQLEDRLRWSQSRKELDVREAKLALNLKQEEVLSQKARSLLEDGLEDQHFGRDFESLRFLRAPASGHVFYLKGYNDLAKRNERVDKEFIVWNGLTVAEILDMSKLAFRISLPERQYHAIREGMELPIELEDLGDRILLGKVATKGRSLYRPRKKKRGEGEAISLNRVFDVTLSFAVPKDLHDQLRPGLRGSVSLP